MTAEDLTDAMAYYAAEPYGAWRADVHAGSLMSLYYTTHKGKRDKDLAWHDFFPNAEKPRLSQRDRIGAFKKSLTQYGERYDRDAAGAKRGVRGRKAKP